MPWTFAHPAAVLPLRRYCPRYLNFSALVVGSLSPDLGYYLDLFTHKGTWLVSNITLLQQTAFHIGTTPLPLYYLLQQISTVLGSAILLIAYCLWLRSRKDLIVSDNSKEQSDRWRYTLLSVLAALALGVGIVRGLEAAAMQHGYYAVRVFLFRTAVDSTSTFVVLLLVCSVLCYTAGQKISRG